MRKTLAVSERRACRVLGQVRRTQRYTPGMRDDEVLLTTSIVSQARHYGRYGYRAEADPLVGDELSRVVTWKGSGDLAGLKGKDVAIRFHLSPARLYSFSI